MIYILSSFWTPRKKIVTVLDNSFYLVSKLAYLFLHTLSLKHVIDSKVYLMAQTVNVEELAGAVLRVLHIQYMSNVPVESHL